MPSGAPVDTESPDSPGRVAADNDTDADTGAGHISGAAPAPDALDEPQDPRPARGGALSRFTMDTRPLRHRPYRRLWMSTLVTGVGSQLTAVAVPKQIYDLTASSAWIGIASFVGLMPLIVFGLWGGAVADAVDRRTLMLVTNIGISATSLALWAQAAAGLHALWLIMVLLAVQQALFGMNSPARGAAIPRLVPRAELPAANALNSTVMLTGALFGPLLAGSLIPLIGLPTLYLIDSVGLTAVLWAVLRLPKMPPAPGTARRTDWTQVRDGFRFVAANPLLACSFIIDLIAMVLGMPRALFPQLAATTYAANHYALGLLYAAIPAGSLIGGLLSGSVTRMRRHGLVTIVAVAVWGAVMAGFGLSGGSLALACLFLALGGAADFVSMIFRSAILQTVAPDAMRGRMQGVFVVVVAGGPRLADLVHGFGGAALGAGTATTLGGIAVVVGALVLAVATPAYRRYRAEA